MGVIECPTPDKDIRRFDTNLRLFPPFLDNDVCPLTIKNTILQSCYLRNTDWACGVAVYTAFMHKVKTTRTVQLDSLCDFSVAENSEKEAEPSESTSSSNTIKNATLEPEKPIEKIEHDPAENKESVITQEAKDQHSVSIHSESCVDEKTKDVTVEHIQTAKSTQPSQGTEACTPKLPVASQKTKNMSQTESKKQQTARKIASAVKNPSVLKSKSKPQISQPKGSKTPAAVRRDTSQVNKNRDITNKHDVKHLNIMVVSFVGIFVSFA